MTLPSYQDNPDFEVMKIAANQGYELGLEEERARFKVLLDKYLFRYDREGRDFILLTNKEEFYKKVERGDWG